MFKCCMELGNNAINKYMAKNLLSCFKCRINNLFQKHTCYSSRFSTETIFPHPPVPTLLKNFGKWNFYKKLILSYFWNYSWEFVTLAKVSHLQPYSPQGLWWMSVFAFGFSFLQGLCSKHDCLYVSYIP